MTDPTLPGPSGGLSGLPEIWEPETAAIREIFTQIPGAVGVPGVHLFWRLLANLPEVLRANWPSLAAALSTRALADGARELRRRALIEEAVGLPSHKAFRGDLVRAEIDADFREKISNFNDLSQYGLSRLLIVVAALNGHSALAGQQARGRIPSAGLPESAVYVPPLREGEARGKAVEILERVQREHGLPLLDDYYRSLGRIPDYLAAAWNAIRPLVNDPEYLARAALLSSHAAAITSQRLPPPPLSLGTPGLSQPPAGQLREMIDFFARVLLPQTLIDVTLIKALTEGPERATTTAFDAAR